MELSKFARIKFLQRFLPNDRERNDLRFRKNGTRFMRVEEGRFAFEFFFPILRNSNVYRALYKLMRYRRLSKTS